MARTVLRGRSTVVEIEPGRQTCIIGERCNALGYRSVRESVEAGDYDLVAKRAERQIAAGADVINVNMVGMSVTERRALPQAVESIAAAVDAPLSIDFGDPDALREALRIVPGRALINSVNGESNKLEPTLELAREYDAAVIAMPSDNRGIPDSAGRRLETAERIVRRAADFGMSVDDLIFDAISIGVATDPGAGHVTFETCRLLRRELGANVVLGASNASFGLPRRRTLDAAYLAMAIASGMNVALTDPTLPVLKWSLLSADCCMGHDVYGGRYIQSFRAQQAGQAEVRS